MTIFTDFTTACSRGDMKTAKFLLTTHIDLKANSRRCEGFRMACANGYLDIAKWLYNTGCININSKRNEAFRLACEYGHLSVAQWLYSLKEDGKESLKLHDEEWDWFFRRHCRDNDIEMVKWLYLLYEDKREIIDIHHMEDSPFRYACKNRHKDIALFLYGKDPSYFRRLNDKESVAFYNYIGKDPLSKSLETLEPHMDEIRLIDIIDSYC